MNQREFWDRCLRAYDGLTFLDDYVAELDHVVKELDLRPGSAVLDAGSGTGNLSVRLRRAGARVTSLDFSPIALEIHREKDPAATLVQSSLEEPLPFPDASFDRIACLSVLFAISQQGTRQALREFKRVLRPGGRVVITVMRPGRSKLRVLTSHFARRARTRPLPEFVEDVRTALPPLLRMLYYNYRMYGLRSRGGYRRFTSEELLTEVQAAGLEVLDYGTTYGGRFHMVRAGLTRSGRASVPEGIGGLAVGQPVAAT